jgi:hypothetical protein
MEDDGWMCIDLSHLFAMHVSRYYECLFIGVHFYFQGSQLDGTLGPQRQKFVQMVARELHKEQPWFHGSIEREGADMVMLESGHLDGKFLYVYRHFEL